MLYKLNKKIIGTLLGINFLITASFAEPINLPKAFDRDAVIVGKFLSGGTIASLEDNQGQSVFKQLDANGQVRQQQLPWQPTHFDFNAGQNSTVFASLPANGHQNAESALLWYHSMEPVLSLKQVRSFQLSNNGKNLLVMVNKNDRLFSQLYDQQGKLIAERDWQAAHNEAVLAYTISPNGSQFVPKPQSIDSEKWNRIKAFYGSNHRLEREYQFTNQAVYDVLALNDDRLVIAVAGQVYFFHKHDVVWEFSPAINTIGIDTLQLSDNGEYILGIDNRSNSFVVLNLAGQVLLEHYDVQNVDTANRLSFLPLRKSQNGLPFNRQYQFKGNTLLLIDHTVDQVFAIDLLTKNHQVIATASHFIDVDSNLQNKLIKNQKHGMVSKTINIKADQ